MYISSKILIKDDIIKVKGTLHSSMNYIPESRVPHLVLPTPLHCPLMTGQRSLATCRCIDMGSSDLPIISHRSRIILTHTPKARSARNLLKTGCLIYMRRCLDIYFLEIFNLDKTCGPQDECRIELFHLKICARKCLVECNEFKHWNIFLEWKGHPVCCVLAGHCIWICQVLG